MEFIQRLASPQQALATHQEEANTQHYEVPTSFLQLCLGPRMKYSSCFYPSLANPDGTSKSISAAKESLGEAEEAMLKMYTVKAGLGPIKGEEDSTGGEGLKILDLGCGWGSLGLYLAEVSARSLISYEALKFCLDVPQSIHQDAFQLTHPKDLYRRRMQGKGLWQR